MEGMIVVTSEGNNVGESVTNMTVGERRKKDLISCVD